MTGNILCIIPLIIWLLIITKKILHTVCLSTITVRSVDQQRNSPPKMLMSLSNRIRWG